MRKLKKTSVFKQFFIAHINIYMFLLTLFVIGLIVGVVQSAFLGEQAKAESYNYISTFLSAFKNSTLLKYLNKGDILKAKDQLLLWNKVTVNGKKIVDKGLANRREKEYEIFTLGY